MTKLGDVQLGDTVVVRGLPCVKDGEERVIKQTVNGELYFDCDKDGHFIHMMVDAHGDVIGVEVKR